MSVIRQSKFKHVFGKALKRDECYDCIPITRNTHDTAFCAVNPKFIAIITESSGGGSFAVIPIEKVGRMTSVIPMVAGHTSAVLDIQWCPHNNNMIASASDDCTVKIWDIPDGGLGKEPLRDSIVTLIGHQRRVHIVLWHPTAQGVIVSASADNMLILWDSVAQYQLKAVEFPNLVTSLSFNYNGSKLAACCKDGLTRIINPRTGNFTETGTCHEGKKPQMCVFVEGDRLFTTGFSKRSERQLALWDSDNLNECLWRQELDVTNGVLFPFYDIDTQLIFVCGKGDSTVRYFEYSQQDKQVYYLDRYDSTDPQRGFAFMPKLGLNVATCEIARMYKLHNKNWCEVIGFTVPRKSGLFQEDLYPDTVAPVATITGDSWFQGQDADPMKVSIKETANASKTSSTMQPPLLLPSTRPAISTPEDGRASHGFPLVLDNSGAISTTAHVECASMFEKMSNAVDNLAAQVKLLEDRIRHLERSRDTGDDSDSASDASGSKSINSECI